VQQFMADRNAAGGQPLLGGADTAAFLTPAAPAEEERKPPVAYRVGKLPKELPAWFTQLDTDQDAQIGLYEWKASGRSIEEFRKIDRNNDGFLTVDEVLRYEKLNGNNGQGSGAAVAASPGNGNGNGARGPAPNSTNGRARRNRNGS